MKVLELVITSIFIVLLVRLFLQSRNSTAVIGSVFKGSTDLISAVVPPTLT